MKMDVAIELNLQKNRGPLCVCVCVCVFGVGVGFREVCERITFPL